MTNKQASKGFTIVELLIVIVVIGILAAITIVAYTGISQQANKALLQSDLEQSYKALAVYQVTNGSFPADQASAGLKSSAGSTLTYNLSSDGLSYCLQAAGFGTSYANLSNDNTAIQGYCSGTTRIPGSVPPPVTPVAVRSTSSKYANTNAVSVNVPAGATTNDIVVVIASTDDHTATISAPDGTWTQLDQKVETSPDGQDSAVFWKRLSGAGSGTYKFTATSSTWFDVAAICFSGASTSTAPSISTVAINTASNTSPVTVTANGLTIANGDALMFAAAADTNGQYGSGWSAPSGFTSGPNEPASGTSWTLIYTATKTGAAAGATGNISAQLIDGGGGFRSGYTAWLVRVPV